MTTWFADTSYYLALLNASDELHAQAAQLTPSIAQRILTTAWVLTEVADVLSRAPTREIAADFIRDLVRDPRVVIVPPSQEVFAAGFDLYADRTDKDWSLTDCISFVVMEGHGLTEALSADHHFEQAGFNIVLK